MHVHSNVHRSTLGGTQTETSQIYSWYVCTVDVTVSTEGTHIQWVCGCICTYLDWVMHVWSLVTSTYSGCAGTVDADRSTAGMRLQ